MPILISLLAQNVRGFIFKIQVIELEPFSYFTMQRSSWVFEKQVCSIFGDLIQLSHYMLSCLQVRSFQLFDNFLKSLKYCHKPILLGYVFVWHCIVLYIYSLLYGTYKLLLTFLLKFTCLCNNIYRELPELARHFVIRLLFVEQPVPQAVVTSWVSQAFAK